MWIVVGEGLVNISALKEVRKNGDHLLFYYKDNTYTELVCNSEPEALAGLKTLLNLLQPKAEIEGEVEV